MIVGGDCGRYLNQVIAYMVSHAVNGILILPDLFHGFRAILVEHVKCTADIGFGQFKHHQKDVITAPEGHGRGTDKYRV